MADTRWLERRRQGWYAVIYVPRALQGALGKKLRRSLQTTDLREAQTKRHLVLAEFKRMVAGAQRPTSDHLTAEAVTLRAEMEKARSGETVIVGYGDDEDSQEAMLQSYMSDRAEQIGDKHGAVVAGAFFGIATGRATPLLLHVPDWLHDGGQKGPYQARTKGQLERDLRELRDWLTEARIAPTVEAVTRRVAARFVTEHLSRSGRVAKTVARIVSSCRSYWTWLGRRGLLEADRNPWDHQAPPKVNDTGHGGDKERAFTDAELATLLAADTGAEMADVIRIAALSGMRIEEVYRLTVRDCSGDVFNVRRSKTRAGVRLVPLHSDLAEIIARRTKGKDQATFLFPEPGPVKEGRERSMAASKRFGHLIRRLGLAEMVAGKRRSLVNFHSLRRWFITAALRANQSERVVQQVVGHKAQGVTLGVYFAGDLDGPLRACVEAVKLPKR